MNLSNMAPAMDNLIAGVRVTENGIALNFLRCDAYGALSISRDSAPSSYGGMRASDAAPGTGVAVEAFATGAISLIGKNLSNITAEYLILGMGESAAEAEANRDAGQFVLRASETDEWRRPSGATHYAWKSATGTPAVWLGQGA